MPIDFAGTMHGENSDLDLDANDDVKMGLGFGAEAMIGVWKELKLGAGIQYGLDRSVDDPTSQNDKDSKFDFIPIYGIIAYGINLPIVNPYGIGRIGYGILSGNDDLKAESDLKGGLYLSLGGGASFNIPGVSVKPFIELNYAFDNGYIELQFGYQRY